MPFLGYSGGISRARDSQGDGDVGVHRPVLEVHGVPSQALLRTHTGHLVGDRDINHPAGSRVSGSDFQLREPSDVERDLNGAPAWW